MRIIWALSGVNILSAEGIGVSEALWCSRNNGSPGYAVVFDIVALGFVSVVAFGILRFVKLILLVLFAEATFVVVIGVGILLGISSCSIAGTSCLRNKVCRVPFPMPFAAIIIDVATMTDKYV